jgi:hypothetical protein
VEAAKATRATIAANASQDQKRASYGGRQIDTAILDEAHDRRSGQDLCHRCQWVGNLNTVGDVTASPRTAARVYNAEDSALVGGHDAGEAANPGIVREICGGFCNGLPRDRGGDQDGRTKEGDSPAEAALFPS